MIVRAKVKHPSDIDPYFLCCDSVRERIAKNAGTELNLISEISFRDFRCAFCGHIQEGMPAMQMAPGSAMPDSEATLMAVPFVDLDEGPVSA